MAMLPGIPKTPVLGHLPISFILASAWGIGIIDEAKEIYSSLLEMGTVVLF